MCWWCQGKKKGKDVWTSILLSYFCSTLTMKQFSFSLLSYIIMYLMPRWLQCRMSENEWDEGEKSSEWEKIFNNTLLYAALNKFSFFFFLSCFHFVGMNTHIHTHLFIKYEETINFLRVHPPHLTLEVCLNQKYYSLLFSLSNIISLFSTHIN